MFRRFEKLHLIPSAPSRKRKVVAGFLFVCFAVLASAIRLSRPDFHVLPALTPWDFGGTSPNFFVGAACPLIAFFQNKSLDLREYVKVTTAAAVGISIYEILQIWIPNRTFDGNDIVASFVGSFCGILVCLPVFFLSTKPTRDNRSE